MAVDFLQEKRAEMTARLKELEPRVDEYQRLEAAAAALDGVASLPAGSARGPGRPTAARAATASRTTGPASARRRGRPTGSGKRRDQALALVRGTPGITTADIAEKLGMQQNYLYRVLPGLAAEGLIVKHGRGWHPAPT